MFQQTKLREWINADKFDIYELSGNPNAYKYLVDNKLVSIDSFDCNISKNPNAIPLIEQIIDTIKEEVGTIKEEVDNYVYDKDGIINGLSQLEKNAVIETPNGSIQISCIIKLLDDYETYCRSHRIGTNENKKKAFRDAVNEKIDLDELCKNPNAIHILEQNIDKVYWSYLCVNKNAIHLLEQNLDKVNYEWLCENPNAIHLLEQNLDKVIWDELSRNPNAIHILEQNLDKVNWLWLCGNTSIFTYDHEEIKQAKLFETSSLFSDPVIIDKYITKFGVDALDDFDDYIHDHGFYELMK